MIVNYDKENGFTSIFKKQKKEIMTISDEVNDFFDKTDFDGFFRNQLDDLFDFSTSNDKNFKSWVSNLDDSAKSAMTAGDALESYKKHLQETSKATSKLASLKGIAKGALGFLGASALNIGASMAATYAIDFAIKKWDEYANAQENAIEAGEKVSSKIKENYDSIASSNQWKNTNLERFAELAKGVNSAGMNMSLSTDEFAEYQTLASSLADTLPNLVTGFNNLGQPILSVGNSVNKLNKAFRDNEIKKYQDNIKQSRDVLAAFKTQYDEQGTMFKESGLKQKIEAYENIFKQYKSSQENYTGEKSAYAEIDFYEKIGENNALNTLKDIAKEAGITVEEFYNNIDKLGESYEVDLQEVQSVVNDTKNALPSFLKVRDDYYNLIGKNQNIDSLMQSVISGFDAGTVIKYLGSPEQIESWAKNVTKGLENSEVQSSINQLFSLDKHKSEMSFKDYKKYTNELSDFIDKNVEGISSKQIRKGLGIDDYLTDFESTYNKLKDIDKEFADTVKIEDYALAEKIISEQDISTVEEFTAALAFAKQEAGSFSLNSFVSEVGNAMALVDQLNAALANSFTGKGLNVEFEVDKESGLITLTGDIENLKNAYQDLDGYDPSLLFEKTANGVHVNREALRALQAQEEALNKKKWMQDKIDLQKKLNEAIKIQQGLEQGTPEWYNSQDSIDSLKSQIETVELLSSAYDGATSAYQKWLAAQSGGEEGDMFRTVSETMKERGAELYKEGRYNTEEFRAIANYFSYEDLSTAPIEKLVEAYKQASNARDRYFTGNKQGIDNFMHDMETISKNEGKNWIKETEDGFIEFDTGADEEISKRFNLSKEAVQAIFRAASEYNDKIRIGDTSSSDDLTQKLQEATEKANQAKESLRSLQEEGKISTDIKFDVDVSELDNVGIDERISSLEKLKEEAIIKFGADSSEVEYVNQLLDEANLRKQQLANETVAGVSVQINNESDIEALGQKLSSLPKDETTNVSIDIQNEEQLNNVANQVNAIPQDTPVNISFSVSNEEQAFALKEKLDSGDKEITYTINYTDNSGQVSELTKDGVKNVTVNEVEGTTVTKNDESKTVTVNYTLGTQDPPVDKSAKVNYEKGSQDNPSKKNANVDYKLGSQDSPSSPKTATVNYTLGTVAKPPAANVKVNYTESTGTMLSPAHANGTAYNTLNISPAHAGGNVAIQKDEKALVNELPKPESIVRDGIWSIIPGGAHLEQLKKGDIIFNGEQTEQLLKYGRIAGHGNAYADGTVGNVRNIISTPLTTAYSKGSWTYGSTGNGNLGGTGYSDTSKQKKKKTSNKSKNTKDTADSAKEFEETLDHIETLIDRTERNIKNLERTATSTYETLGTRTDALKSELSEITKEIDIQSKAYDRYLQEANSVGLSEDYAEKVRNGLIDLETITDEELNKSISQYREYYEKALDCRDTVEELKESVKGLYEESFNNLVKEYDNMLAQIDHRKNILEGYIEQTETQGYIVSTKYYAELIKNEQSNLEDLTSKRNSLLASLNDAVANGNIKMYSESWYEMRQEINDVDEAIQSANTSIIEYGNSIRNIKWDVFDKLQDKISGITDESDFLIDLMSNDKLFDDKGNITEQGKASMGLHGVNYNTYMSQADQYRKEMEAVQAEIAKDPYNQELIDRRKELLELQQESIIAAENEKEAIKDLVEEGIDKQLESLQDLIDKQGEMLDSQKDMYDWQKEIAEKQKDIATLEKMLGAYSGDDSEEGMAKRQELSNELGEAKTELDESFFEKSISEQKKLLDELYNQYELVLNARLDNIDMLITDMIANINSESSGIRDTIISEAANVGYTITDSMNQIWTDNTNNIAGILTTYSSNFSSVMTSVQQALNEIKVYIQNAVNASNKKAETNINTTNKNQADQVKPPAPKPNPSVPKPESPKNSGVDGVPKIGDAVTFASGRYYYSSDGLNPSGKEMLGQTVYIGHINNASWAKKPYAIYRDKEFKRGLGWVSLDQLQGYSRGTTYVSSNKYAWMDEYGKRELIVRKKDNAILSNVQQGDAIINNDSLNNILALANNPRQFVMQNIGDIDSMLSSSPSVSNISSDVNNMNNNVEINISIDKVMDYNDFIAKFQSDPKADRIVKAMTLNEIAGKGRLSKYNVKL